MWEDCGVVSDCEELVGVTWRLSDCEELVGLLTEDDGVGIMKIVTMVNGKDVL